MVCHMLAFCDVMVLYLNRVLQSTGIGPLSRTPYDFFNRIDARQLGLKITCYGGRPL